MKLRNVRKTYHNQNNDVEALKGISLDLNNNGITVILGSSGCGKTTLLNCIASKETYEGIIEDVPSFDYLTQDFNLFEDMSVYDNLCIVSEDHKLIRRYLKQFDLKDTKNQKVKKLSNGQKKRVQFIRALLHHPGLLLCDEPTASLDHENAELLMKSFRSLSDNMQIIVVTHDIALAEEYADRIIRIDEGRIVQDETYSSLSSADHGKEISKKGKDDTLLLVIREMRSRIAATLASVLLACLSVLTVFTTCSLYFNVSSQSDYASAFKNAENMVVSVPKKKEANQGETISGYASKYCGLTVNDLFSMSDVQTIIDQTPEIIGVESYNSRQYQQDEELRWALTQNDLQAYQTFEYNGMVQANTPEESPYVLPNDFQTLENWVTYRDTDYLNYPKYLVQAFDITKSDDIPLLAGSASNGVVLSKNTADMVKEMNGYSSYEEMIGKPLKLALQGYENRYYRDIEAEPLIDIIEVNIDGISSVENDYINMIFFYQGFGNNPIDTHYIVNRDMVKMQYVRFLLKPGCDYKAVAEKISNFFAKENVDITVFHGLGLGKEKEFYQSASGFGIYAVIVSVLVVMLLVLSILFRRKKLIKEAGIMETYGYSCMMEKGMRYGISAVFTLLISSVLSVPIVSSVNAFASSHYYQPFMRFNLISIVLITIVIHILLFVIESVTARKKYD